IYSSSTPAEDLALEEAIQLELEEGRSPETWRIWQASRRAVILGTGQEAAKEVFLETAAGRNVDVLRRHSGGGAVVIGPGVLNFSAFHLIENLPGSETIRGAMTAALRPLVEWLASFGIKAVEAGLSDLAIQGSDGTLRKIAGNSQARKKRSVLVHGTILADPDFSAISELLRFPSKVPDYRVGRDHRGFLTSLKEQGLPHDLQSLTQGIMEQTERLSQAGNSSILMASQPTAAELSRAHELLNEKYSRSEWNLRR
ncbi:MAG TPA: biotin/lipoate A/B protein ligase family protein, partial [Planctomycetota bacterium]|nr:biotin/lipoate A/B protein ligase family protein [Planctomycetota bacterium]